MGVSTPLLSPQPVLTVCADFEGKVVGNTQLFNKLGTAMPLSMEEEGPEFRVLWW